ncbi:tRNA (adenosine(37)-N6)-threonylcarbamoyltransferase complex ATPase subunit type 1 TsaE [Candidatus Gottesmanbacteria bacterium RBG_16_52_11]|uniref:tRNA threonylcarbamoyladenosine biosynthesis protein TsaE n=1 Tax=Candidatus Gottesmanbacteria bacterium RBG_16_52_11 TaxID=1798374 RepID=A0A1F5YML9_9BACT|nr:MAG: tRNA (adenosine(37)-N6)-threonylcarbamoyltransferase complex ATPase subunit type 1 TsaE [Candidatus Gottesmanbacteria bacterium RBG_16_52_11]
MVRSTLYSTSSERETRNLGQAVGNNLKQRSGKPVILALYGKLGSGKTTFIRGLASGLGISGRIISPTFVLIRQYNLKPSGRLFHLDLYRLHDRYDLDSIGIGEILTAPGVIAAVEWADRVKGFLPKERTDIRFEVTGQYRRISFAGPQSIRI